MEEKELRLGYAVDDWKQEGEAVLAELEKQARKRPDLTVADDSCEGVRVSNEYGFFLIRMSVHDPVLPVNFEAKVAGGVAKLQELLYSFLKANSALNLSVLEDALSQTV